MAASHLSKAFQVHSTEYTARQQFKKIALRIKRDDRIKAIAVTGVSGMVAGAVISYLSNKPLIVVRKDGDDCHSMWTVETSLNIYSQEPTGYVFLDDLIESGDTLMHVVKRIRQYSSGFKLVAFQLYLYDSGLLDLSTEDSQGWEVLRNTIKSKTLSDLLDIMKGEGVL